MRKAKSLSLTVVAVFALSGVTATAASAASGYFVNKAGETVKGKIKITSTVTQVLETLAGVKLTCTAASGEAEAKNTMLVVQEGLTAKGCKKSTGGTCKSAGAAVEEIKVGTLDLLLVLEDKEGKPGADQVLVTLLSTVEFECAEVKVTVKKGGEFLTSSVTPQGTLGTKFVLSVECGTAGMQKQASYFEFGKLLTIPESLGLLTKIGAAGSFEGSCQSGSAEMVTAEEAKII